MLNNIVFNFEQAGPDGYSILKDFFKKVKFEKNSADIFLLMSVRTSTYTYLY